MASQIDFTNELFKIKRAVGQLIEEDKMLGWAQNDHKIDLLKELAEVDDLLTQILVRMGALMANNEMDFIRKLVEQAVKLPYIKG